MSEDVQGFESAEQVEAPVETVEETEDAGEVESAESSDDE